jgi:hydrogenase maturation factor
MIRNDPNMIKRANKAFANMSVEQIRQYADMLDKAADDPNILKEMESMSSFNDKEKSLLSSIQEGISGTRSMDKEWIENIVKNYTNVLYLRINYPLSSCSNPKNLLTKLKCFTQISDSKFSITCIDSLFPLLSSIVENKEIGIMNFVNPGTISLVDIKKKYNIINNINNNYEIIITDRPSIILDTTRIEKYHPENINSSIENILQTFYN